MDRHTLEAQLGTIKVPIVHIPWVGEIGADVPQLGASMLEWADQKGLLVDVAYRERVKRSHYAWLAARCHPRQHPSFCQSSRNSSYSTLLWTISFSTG